MVLTCKKGLRKICLTRNKEDWDLALPYIAMGYEMSKHASLSHFAPYFLLFGRHPIPPFSIVAQMDQVVDLDSLTIWVIVFRRVIPMAMENLCIAQHRNTLRYAHTRGDSYKPKVKQFNVSDFVYFQRQLNDTLNTSFGHIILKIKVIRPLGVLDLQGVDGHTIQITPKIVRPTTCRTWILSSSCQLGSLHLTIHVRHVRG
jgi:hypothetical protein